MRRLITLLFAAALILISFASPEKSYSDQGESDVTRNFGIGIQAAPFPVLGLGMVYNVNKQFGVQVIAKTGWDVDILSIRALYRFTHKPNYNVYASGLFGIFRDTHVQSGPLAPEQTDQANGYGFGGGIEYFFAGAPRIGWNLELDFIHIYFQEKWWEYDYETFSLLMLGLGVHYYFSN